jgi:hypothetical protein
MNDREFEPVESGQDISAPQHRGKTPQKEERQRAGTPPALEGNIDNTIDKNQDTVNEPRAQAYAIRWLMSHHGIPVAIAAVVASELGMEDAQ